MGRKKEKLSVFMRIMEDGVAKPEKILLKNVIRYLKGEWGSQISYRLGTLPRYDSTTN